MEHNSSIKTIIRKYMPNQIKLIIFFLYNAVFGLIYRLLYIVPISKNKVVVNNFDGKAVGDDLLHIVKKLQAKNQYIDVVWIMDKKNFNNDSYGLNIRKVRTRSFSMMFEYATASVWVFSTRSPLWLRKRKGQYYIQLWHGALALKKIEAEAKSLFGGYIIQAKSDSKKADLFVSASGFMSRLYRDAFWYNGKILESGYPKLEFANRNCNDIECVQLKKRLNIDPGCKIVLYAPTFRRFYDEKVYNLNFDSIITALQERFGGKWCTLVRLHPSISEKSKHIVDSNPNTIDGSMIGDIYEFFPVIDCVISDFSSLAFEYLALYERPVFLFSSDYKEYANERGLSSFSVEINILQSMQELLASIRHFNQSAYRKWVLKIRREIELYLDKKPTEQLVSMIKTRLNVKQ